MFSSGRGVGMGGHERDEDNLLLSEVFDLLAQNDDLPEQAQYVVLAAFEDEAAIAEALGGQAPPAKPSAREITPVEEPVGAFLKSISVCGFRGIGSRVELELHPTAGLTVVAGRNGSGKSSFSEALEFAITGNTYRWSGKKSPSLRLLSRGRQQFTKASRQEPSSSALTVQRLVRQSSWTQRVRQGGKPLACTPASIWWRQAIYQVLKASSGPALAQRMSIPSNGAPANTGERKNKARLLGPWVASTKGGCSRR